LTKEELEHQLFFVFGKKRAVPAPGLPLGLGGGEYDAGEGFYLDGWAGISFHVEYLK
jgi:hypothetical protein